jgi:CubicO group peptidase (beta-lactamase class C family)
MRIIFTRFIQILLVLLPFTSCHVGRYFYWNYASIKDYRKFPHETIKAGKDVFTFQSQHETIPLKLPEQFASVHQHDDLSKFLEEHKTVAFIVIRNDTVLFEEYYDGYTASEVIGSFSAAKAFVSAMTGIAIGEGKIRTVQEPVTNFLPELLDADPRFGNITIGHLLNMRSGIRFNEGYANPFADMAKYYYGTNLKKYITQLKIERPPDEVYDYISVNTQLLGMALERATGHNMAAYLEQKIWQPAGMEYDASWSVDSKQHRQIKAFCCINLRPVDLARFGRLYLNGGRSSGKQIIPEAWVKQSMQITNDSRDSQGYPYTYQWRVKNDGAIFAKGILGQFLYVYPEKNVIIVRMGKKDAGLVWPEFFERLCDQL